MSTEQHLAQYGVSIAAAKNFILLNLNRPDFIFSTAQSFGITNEMLGDIYGGASKYQVVDFSAPKGSIAPFLKQTLRVLCPMECTFMALNAVMR